MSTELTCPQCHSPLPPDAPAGLCPRCLIRSAAGLGEPPPDVDFPDIGDAADVARRLPQFEIIELLGQGGMGVVYKARQPQLDRIVALKILPPADALTPDFVERFRREARALAKLNHPNIVHVYECGEQGGLYFFVMEFVDGANLRALLQSKSLTPAEALAIVPQVCDALEYAHEEGIVHRDIKPENILIDKKGRLKIADFGLAKLLRREAMDVSLTMSGTSLGTVRYMAPEQMEKPETVDHRADIYSLGVVIYEMLTGEVPMGRFAPPSEKVQVDVKLDEIVLHALERDVERRYQHASEVKTDVERVTRTSQAVPATTPAPVSAASSAASSPPVPPASSTASKPPTRHLLSACLVLLMLFGFFFGFSFHAKSTMTPAGRAETITIGALDPLYVKESGPSGFHFNLNFFSWSFFAVVVAGVAFGALWRIGREDQGKVPRDPAWWRAWWKQVGIWCGLLLAVCIFRTVKDPQSVLKYTDAKRPSHGTLSAANVRHTDGAVTYFEGHTSAVKAVAVSPDGRTLVSAGPDGRVIIRDLPDGQVRRIAVNTSHPKLAPDEQFRSAAILADNAHALIGGNGGKNGLMKVHLFKNQLERLVVPNEFGATFTQLLLCDFGSKFAYIAGGTELNIFDMNARRLIAQPKIFPGKFFSNVHAAAVSPDGAFIAVPSSNMEPMAGGGAQSAEPCKLTVFDLQGVERLSWQFADYADFSYAQVAFIDTRTLVVCLPSGKMQRWTLDNERKWQPAAETVRISPGRYTASAVSRDGKIIWLAENQQVVGIDSATGKGVAFIDLKIGEKKENYSGFAIEQIAVTSDPLTIAAALWDGRVALAKCWPLDGDATKAKDGASTPGESSNSNDPAAASTAADLLRRAGEKYAGLKSLTAAGRVVSEVTSLKDGRKHVINGTFQLNLARPEFYRLQWTDGLGASGAAWSAGDGHHVLIAGKVTDLLDRDMALAMAQGVSSGVALTLPGAFFNGRQPSPFVSLANPQLRPSEAVDGESCHVIQGEGKGQRITVCLRERDLLLRKMETRTDAESVAPRPEEAEDLSDETLGKLLRATGQKSTPEKIAQMRQMREMAEKAVAENSVVTTQFYEKTTVNDFMIKEDFEVATPAPEAPPAK